MEETATSSADAAEVTAKKRRMSMVMAPVAPRRVDAATGAGSPAATWDAERGLGKLGKAGSVVRTTAASPRVEANPRGTDNQADPLRTVSVELIRITWTTDAPEEEGLVGRLSRGSDRTLEVGLVQEDGRKVSDLQLNHQRPYFVAIQRTRDSRR